MDARLLAAGIIVGLVVGIAGGFYVSGASAAKSSTQTSIVTQTTTNYMTQIELGATNKTLTTTQTYVAYSTETANSSEIASLQSQVDALQIQAQDLRSNMTKLQAIAQLGASEYLTVPNFINQSQGGTYSVSDTLQYAGLLSISLNPANSCTIGSSMYNWIVEVSWSRSSDGLNYNSTVNISQSCGSSSSPVYFVVMPSLVTISVRDPNYQPFQANWVVQYIY